MILSCLADDHAVQAVLDQIEPFLTAQQVIVDFSSLSVDQTQKPSAASQPQTGAHGLTHLYREALREPNKVRLVIFAGGDANTIEKLSPIYHVLSQRVTRMGETGTGQATKICNQLIVAANSTLIAEAVALAGQAGVDTRLLAPALAGGFADSKPFQILTPRMATHSFEPVQWKVQTLSKDLNNALQLAAQFQLQIPVAEKALSQLQAHQAKGFAEADLATIIHQVEA